MTNRVHVMTFLLVLALAALAPAQTFTTLYSFPNGSGGGLPYAGLTKSSRQPVWDHLLRWRLGRGSGFQGGHLRN